MRRVNWLSCGWLTAAACLLPVAYRLVPIAALAEPPLTSMPLGGPVAIQKRAVPFGCAAKDDVVRLNRHLVRGDIAAFIRALGDQVQAGRCRQFKTGDLVYVVAAPFGEITVRVRREGEDAPWYVNGDDVMTKAQSEAYMARIKAATDALRSR